MSEFSPIRNTTNIDPQRALQQSVRSSLSTESESAVKDSSRDKTDVESSSKPSFEDILKTLNERVNNEIDTAKQVEAEKVRVQDQQRAPVRNAAGFVNAKEDRSLFGGL